MPKTFSGRRRSRVPQRSATYQVDRPLAALLLQTETEVSVYGSVTGTRPEVEAAVNDWKHWFATNARQVGRDCWVTDMGRFTLVVRWSRPRKTEFPDPLVPPSAGAWVTEREVHERAVRDMLGGDRDFMTRGKSPWRSVPLGQFGPPRSGIVVGPDGITRLAAY